MNIFSNVGITELILILLLALLVVGPERLPELARKLGETLRDLRKAYDNLTRDLGPELQSLQKSAQELRDSVDSVRTIPQDAIKSATKAAGLDETMAELKDVKKSLDQVGTTIAGAGKIVKDPVGAAVNTARETLLTKETPTDEATPAGDQGGVETAVAEAESVPEADTQAATAEPEQEPIIAPPDKGGKESEEAADPSTEKDPDLSAPVEKPTDE